MSRDVLMLIVLRKTEVISSPKMSVEYFQVNFRCVLILYKNFGAGGKKGGKALFHILNLEQPWDLPLLVGIVLPIDGTIT